MLAGHPANAAHVMVQLRQLAPGDPSFLYNHGVAELACGRADEARKLFEAALSAAPDSSDVRQALAKIYTLEGDSARAVKLLEEAVAAAPTEPGPVNDLACLYMSQEGGNAQAGRVLAPVLAAHPGDASAHLNQALACANRDKAAGKRHAQQALEAAKVQGHKDIQEQAQRILKSLGT